MTEQQSLFDLSRASNEAAESHEPTRGRADEERRAAAARAAELNHQLEYHAYRYYALDAPEIRMQRSTRCSWSSSSWRLRIPSS